MITGIIVALPEELATLTKLKIKQGRCEFLNSRLIVAHAGTGAENARIAAKLLLNKGATQLISWGCAAALIPELNSGDLLLPAQLLNHQHQLLEVSPQWLQHCQTQLSKTSLTQSYSYNGRLTESLTLVETISDKQQLQQQTAAIAVDMESCAIAQVALNSKKPFLVIRTIADTAEMALPRAVSFALDDKGKVQLFKLLSFLCFQPQELPALIRLGVHFHKAQSKLKAVAKHLDTIASFK